jgi:hypothetical protein
VSPGIRSGTAGACYLLREDTELAEAIPPERRAQALASCTAAEVEIGAGQSGGPALASMSGGLGMVVLSGFLVRRVGIEGRFGAEVLGEGDLLRPWQWEAESPTLPLQTGWSVVEATRLALLDDDFVSRCLGPFPELVPVLVSRAMQRARNLAVNMAIVNQARVDVRLHMLLWHLAGRWGRVRSDGTILRLRLTHALLADLVAARRPTVTSALSELSRQGVLRGAGDEWVLFGEPPGELADLDEVTEARQWSNRLASTS